ncbi:MAG: class I SAM-dependent methyltransferase [Acidobacteria bacterium]|nr:class I SAM-dependent methyltransferase [Acidobacteriota bacterium]
MQTQPNYGIDAPNVIRNLLIASACATPIALFGPPILRIGSLEIGLHPMAWSIAIYCTLSAGFMLLYAKFGKFRHRDRMLNLHAWTGTENVLDVGTGRGLLLVGAARKLTSGHATGIDVWNKEDLSGNALDRTQQNLALEGVTAKCTLRSEPAQSMSFRSNTFDVILSNLCLHNIYDKPTRIQACNEIARVLKPGGIAILSDYKLTAEYEKTLRSAGLQVQGKFPNMLTTFPPLRIIVARKP